MEIPLGGRRHPKGGLMILRLWLWWRRLLPLQQLYCHAWKADFILSVHQIMNDTSK
jgi:hypothetical protein